MITKEYLAFICDVIHTCVVATVDENGHPVTCAVDMMDYDDHGLYFLTAKGKSFYERLIRQGYLSLTAIKGEDTMSSTAVSIRGKVKELGYEKAIELIEKNSYMNEIYPNEESKKALSAFLIYEGNGEWFDLSKKPIERDSFVLGDIQVKEDGYYIADTCIGCGSCMIVCPQECIDASSVPHMIYQENCLRCGNCLSVCPVQAVVRR